MYPDKEKQPKARRRATTKARSLPAAVCMVSRLVGCMVRIVTIPADTAKSRESAVARNMERMAAPTIFMVWKRIFFMFINHPFLRSIYFMESVSYRGNEVELQ